MIIVISLVCFVIFFGIKRRCPRCGKFFAIKKMANSTSLGEHQSSGIGINGAYFDKDFSFKGFSVGETNQRVKTVSVKCKCRFCNYEYHVKETVKLS